MPLVLETALVQSLPRFMAIGKHWNKDQFNTLASGRFCGFLRKKHRNAHGFAWEFLGSCKRYRPSQSLKSLVAWTKNKMFCLRGEDFCEWRHNWKNFRPPWPTSCGPGRQPLDGSISLKFLLETRLQSESFYTLDDLLGFRVQKLWLGQPKINKVKIFFAIF